MKINEETGCGFTVHEMLVFNNRVTDLVNRGMSLDAAEAKAEKEMLS